MFTIHALNSPEVNNYFKVQLKISVSETCSVAIIMADGDSGD
jgi:hypothetical protein